MKLRTVVWCVIVCASALAAAQAPGARFDGAWTTTMACEEHGQMPAYNWTFPSVIKDGSFHGQHGEEGGPGYLVIDGPIGGDGGAKLHAKGTVTQSQAHGVFALKGNNYDYNIEAKFTDASGAGTRDKGAGILGRPCSFEFTKQTGAAAAPSPQ